MPEVRGELKTSKLHIVESKGGLVPIKVLYDICLRRLNSQTNKPMGTSQTFGTNMVFACYLLLKEANIHINLICLDRNFNNPHIIVVTFVPKNSQKAAIFPTKTRFFVVKVFDMYLFFGLSSLLVKI